MLEYSDPTQSGALQGAGALLAYRTSLHGSFRHFGRRPRSAFTIPEALEELADKSLIHPSITNGLGDFAGSTPTVSVGRRLPVGVRSSIRRVIAICRSPLTVTSPVAA